MRITARPGLHNLTVRSDGSRCRVEVNVRVAQKFPQQLLKRLAAHAASRGVSRLNILNSEGPLKFVRITCRSMTIPIEVLDYALKNKLPFDVLEQPDRILFDPVWGIKGDGIIIALA